jgi:hypothetical protein
VAWWQKCGVHGHKETMAPRNRKGALNKNFTENFQLAFLFSPKIPIL